MHCAANGQELIGRLHLVCLLGLKKLLFKRLKWFYVEYFASSLANLIPIGLKVKTRLVSCHALFLFVETFHLVYRVNSP